MTWTTWIGGALAGAVVAFVAGYLMRDRLGAQRAQSAERRARDVIDQAGREAESVKRDAILEGREEALRLKQQVERESQNTRNEHLAAERVFQEKEGAFNRRVDLIEKKDRDLKRSEQDLLAREAAVQARTEELERLVAQQRAGLERVAGLSAEEARSQLIGEIESEARAEAVRRVSEIRENAQRNAEREARKVLTLAIQRYASDHVSESTVSVVHLPSDDMK
ncbi:MAG: Rnase Y domain-containing protein, partial [Candidatus Eiseniibacteriota bacterium]